MYGQIPNKLWVAKFCVKVLYPKFNFYAFFVFLVIKYRIYHLRRLSERAMDKFLLTTAPSHVMRMIVKEHLEYNLPVLLHKCVIISREQYIQLCADNLFYLDNGVIWLAIKLTPEMKRKYKNTKQNSSLKLNLSGMTAELHKKLWNKDDSNSIENVRIVPVVGSKLVQNDVAITCENEFYNIVLSFGVSNCQDLLVSFHPVPNVEASPKIATAAEVNVIANAYDLPNDAVKEVLCNFFETPKLVNTNDVFSIDLTPNMTRKYYSKYQCLLNHPGKLYFKCKRITNDSKGKKELELKNIVQPFFIVKGATQLTLAENIHSLKPTDRYFSPQELDKNGLNFLQLCPSGLKEKFDQIQEAIRPFLTGEINDLSSAMPSPIIPMLLLTGSIGSGRHILVETLAKYNGMNCLKKDCNKLHSTTAKQTELKINSLVTEAKAAAPAIVLLDNFEVFAVDHEDNEDCRVIEHFSKKINELYENYTKHSIIFIAVTEKTDLKPNILRIFLERFHIPKLNLHQRREMMQWFAAAMELKIDGNGVDIINKFSEDEFNLNKNTTDVLKRVAAKTDTFSYGDLDTLIHFAMRESYLKQFNGYKQPPTDPDLQLVKEEDFNSALESIRSLQSQHLDAPKIPKVYWEDIGGLDKLKKELLKTIEFPIKYPHLFKNSALKRSGILMYGPPGCGKTLVAKAVSTELSVSFLSVKGPELLNMYIGQSEENVRKVFESARASSPCIVFLDELDALAPARGAAGDSGGASDRVVSQLLAELDGVAQGEDADSSSMVFIMGATNRPDLLEQSLLRPGRLDKMIYVGPYCGQREKTSVLRALCRNVKLRPEVDLEGVAAALPDRCTGADLLQVTSTARSAAIRALVAKLHEGAMKESELSPESIVLGVSEFLEAVQAFRPSVTDEELAYYESLQSQM